MLFLVQSLKCLVDLRQWILKTKKNIAAIKYNNVRALVIFFCKGALQEYNISAAQPLQFFSTKPGLDVRSLSQVFDRHAQP